jgi:hypothetical protein
MESFFVILLIVAVLSVGGMALLVLGKLFAGQQ